MYDLIIFLVLVAIGYISGTIAERRHYRSIEAREQELLSMPIVNFKTQPRTGRVVRESRLVTGSAVISIDYFKRILAGLRNIFGGEVSSYASLVDRARREALLRMAEAAKGADMVLNCRVETSSIGQSANKRKMVGSIEALAYGTAVFYEEAG